MEAVNVAILAMDLIVPIVMIIIGFASRNHVPKNRYGAVGYRTKRSRSSQEAWEYANKECSKYMLKYGLILLIVSIVVCLPFLKSTTTVVSIVCTVLIIVQCVVPCFSILLIEKQLKEKFGE